MQVKLESNEEKKIKSKILLIKKKKKKKNTKFKLTKKKIEFIS